MNYYTKFINFLKRNGIDNDVIFKYIHERTKIIDYSIEELRQIRGVYSKYNKQEYLEDFVLYIDVTNDETILLSIRPYIKAICTYYNLGRAYEPDLDIESETLAIYFEKLYLKEYPNKKSKEYLENIYRNITNEQDNSKYKIALITEEMLEKTNTNITCFEELHEKAKSLRIIKSK